MIYLFSRILLWLFAAALLGGAVGWLLRGISWRSRLAELESTWRHHLNTSEKENANLAAERDRLLADISLVKSSHSSTLPRIGDLEAELDAARAAHSGCDEEREKLEKKLSHLEKLTDSSTPSTMSGDDTGTPQREDDQEVVLVIEADGEDPPGWLLGQPEGEKDDLKKIKGVGPVLERTLNNLGIFHFRQIAGFGGSDIEWVASNINTFSDRIVRDNWVAQAAELERKSRGDA